MPVRPLYNLVKLKIYKNILNLVLSLYVEDMINIYNLISYSLIIIIWIMYFCAKFHIFYITLFWYVIALCLLGLYTLYYSYIIIIVRFLFEITGSSRRGPRVIILNSILKWKKDLSELFWIWLSLFFFQAVIENLKRFSSLGSI